MEPLVDKIINKLASWNDRLLSQNARLILLIYVLSSMHVHILLVIYVPKSTTDRIHSILANFLLGKRDGKMKLHWRAWSKVRKPTREGELGLKELQEVQKSL